MKILFYGESPLCDTGMGVVSQNILPVLHEMGELSAVVVNQVASDVYNPERFPMTIYPAPKEEMLNLENARKHILEDAYDVLFLTGDINVIESLSEEVIAARQRQTFHLVSYVAIDNPFFNREHLRCLRLADTPVVFSHFAEQAVSQADSTLAGKIQVIYHGCNPTTYYPLPDEERERFRREAFFCDKDTFLVVNVNRNNPRKDLGRSMQAFHLFHQQVPHSRMYLHSKKVDFGGSLPDIAHNLGMQITGNEPPEILFTGDDFHERNGVSRQVLNYIYNAADVFITSSTGEGWGLTTTEAMSAGVPIIAPNNTVFPELMGEARVCWAHIHHQGCERGITVQSGGPDLWAIPYTISEGPRELCSTQGLVQALTDVYNHRREARTRAYRARAWTEKHTWQHIQEEWRHLLSFKMATTQLGIPVMVS